jgi:hypothetical protein
MNPMASLKRTCPWCGDAHVYAFTQETLERALADHLKYCQGGGPDEEPLAEPESDQ